MNEWRRAISRRLRMPGSHQGTAVGAVLCLALALVWGPGARSAHAGPNAFVDLQVTFNGQLSISVDGLTYSTRSFSAGANAFVVPGSATVMNTSVGLTETWELSVATAAGGGNWAVLPSTQTAPDVDEFAYQALFISSATTLANQPGGWAGGCPDLTTSDWGQYGSIVTGAPALYTSNLYSDPRVVGGASGIPDAPPTGGGPNDNMLPASSGGGLGTRGLCARMWMPSGTESAFIGVPQVVRLTISAMPGN